MPAYDPLARTAVPKPRPQPSRAPSPSRPTLFSFRGRITRRTYWLGHIGVLAALRMLLWTIEALSQSGKALAAQGAAQHLPGLILVLAGMAALLAVMLTALWIGVCLTVRRWHDRDRSGAWALLGFVPIVGLLWQFIECGFMDGTLGPNRFGPSPKGITGVTYDNYDEAFA